MDTATTTNVNPTGAVSTPVSPDPNSTLIPYLLPNPPSPSRFKGETKNFRAFLTQCRLHFLNKPQIYDTDQAKVMFILMHLEGGALDWATPLIDQQDPILKNYDTFLARFSAMFECAHERDMRQSELLDYRQGSKETQEYLTRFQLLAANTNWPDDLLIKVLYKGLKEEIKDMILTVLALPTVFSEYVSLVIQIEQRLKDRRKERRKGEIPILMQKFPYSRPPVKDNEEPMQLGGVRGPLTAHERDRRRKENLCFYCGSPGHCLNNCPMLSGKRPRPMYLGGDSPSSNNKTPRVLGIVNGDAPYAPHLYLDIIVSFPGQEDFTTRALLDCGANGNYMDRYFQQQHQIPIRKRSKPELALSVDDSPLKSGQVEDNTLPLLFSFQGIEMKEQFDIVHIPSFHIIMGMPWLIKWNPCIDWKARTVKIEAPISRYVNAITENTPTFVSKANKRETEVLPLFPDKVPLVDYAISTQGKEKDLVKLRAIDTWEVPHTFKGLQRFLGFANSYRQYIPDYSETILPLTRILKKRDFYWGQEQQAAFEYLKREFVNAPVLINPDFTKPFTVETNASSSALGAVLSQKDMYQEYHPVAYYSRKLSQSEQNYPVLEKELLAIREALKQWRCYLEGTGNHVTIYMDPKNLIYLKDLTCHNIRLTEWSGFFSRFDYTLTYQPGMCNARAGALSRSYGEVVKCKSIPAPILVPKRVIDTMYSVLDAFFQKVRDSYRTCGQTAFLEVGPLHKEIDGLFFHGSRLWVPSIHLQQELLRWCHDASLVGHPNSRKTLDLVSRYVWWFGMKKTVEEYVLLCPICARSGSCPSKPQGVLQPFKVHKGPWREISMEFITNLPLSNGKTVVLVVTDLFSEMVHVIGLAGLPTAAVLVEVFLSVVIRLHGIPDAIVCNCGSPFRAKFWREFNDRLGITLLDFSDTPPPADGSTKRDDQTLERFLRIFCMMEERSWCSALPLVEFLYNNSYHSTVKNTPFCALMGYHPRFLPSRVPSASLVPEVSAFLKTFSSRVMVLTSLLLASKAATTIQANVHGREAPVFQVGDKVWLSTENLRFRGSSVPKRLPHFLGPYFVEIVFSPFVLKLCLPPGMRCHPVFHVSQLKSCDVATPSKFLGASQIAKIIDSRLVLGGVQYLIARLGYGPEDRSWEPASTVHAPRLQAAFHARWPAKPKPVGAVSGGGGNVRIPPVRGPRFVCARFPLHSPTWSFRESAKIYRRITVLKSRTGSRLRHNTK